MAEDKSGTNAVSLVLDFFPPSANKMYTHTAYGPRKSDAMEKFLAQAHLSLGKQLMLSKFYAAGADIPYRLRLRFVFTTLYNAGWPKKAKTLYKKRDVSNLIKVLEDVVAKTTGIDDCNFLEIVASKEQGPDNLVLIDLEEIVDFNSPAYEERAAAHSLRADG